jgi:hypothetical protein
VGELHGILSIGRVIAPKNLETLSDEKRRAGTIRCGELFSQLDFGSSKKIQEVWVICSGLVAQAFDGHGITGSLAEILCDRIVWFIQFVNWFWRQSTNCAQATQVCRGEQAGVINIRATKV